MAVTNIPNVTNWTVTPINGQAGYFTLMNTWLSQSTSVIASLQTAITAQNTANGEINALAIQVANDAIIATGLTNFQGSWSSIVTYSKGQSVESTTGSKIYYISKVDSNLNHAVTDTNYWLANPINTKAETNQSFYIGTTAVTINRASGAITLAGVSIDGTAGVANSLNPSNTYSVSKLTATTGEIRTQNHSGTPNNGVVFFGTGVSYLYKNGNKWEFNNIESGFNNFLDTSGSIVTANGGNWNINATALNTVVGSAPSYACRAWVNFNGTGTVAIRASGNVSSITDNGVGDYSVNFTTAMADTNYNYTGTSGGLNGSAVTLIPADFSSARSVSSFRIATTIGGSLGDVPYVQLSVFR